MLGYTVLCPWSSQASVVINEFMHRPPGTPEPTNLEFIELYNPDDTEQDLSNVKFDKGVDFTFAFDSTLPAHGYVVVVANVATFKAAHPTVPEGIIYGPWTGTLSNTGQSIRVVDEVGTTLASVKYGSEGDWANRVRGALDNGQQGWEWSNPAEGTGKSWELRNLQLDHSEGQNWTASGPVGGTPGLVNSVVEVNSAPLILDVRHFPAIPKPTEVVTIEARLEDVPTDAVTGTVRWRISNSSPGAFATAPLVQQGVSSTFRAVLPAQPNLTVIEFYISSTDGTASRTWPAPNNLGQTTNCLYQVDNEVLAAGTPTYRVVMSVPEQTQFSGMTTHTDAGMNCTFIGDDGSGPSIRYQAHLRYRGASSRDFVPAPNRVDMPADRPYNGSTKLNLNSKFTYLQFLGMKLMYASGVRAPDTKQILYRRNGVNPITNLSAVENYGHFAHLEPLGSEFINHHYPNDSSGNLYKKVRPDNDWAYRAGSVATYLADGWIKESNTAAYDWTQLDNFLKVMTQAQGQANYLAQVQAVADLDQWARWFAVETILANGETNASNGVDDDYSLYFSGIDGRVSFVPHDFDTILGQGDSSRIVDPNRTLFDMTEESDSLAPLGALFGTTTGGGNATFRAQYFTALRDLCLTSFSQAHFDALLDNNLPGWVPTSKIGELKSFMNSRRVFILGQCATALGTPTPTAPQATYTSSLTSPVKAVQISEVLAKNVSAYATGGVYYDYLELHNTTGGDLNLDGMKLVNTTTPLLSLVFPVDTILPADGYLTIPAGTLAAGLHLGFTLDQDGGTVRLLAPGGTVVLDSITWGPQVANLSISRLGATPTVWSLTNPTPNAANGAALALADPNGLKFNEWLALPKNRADEDFLEIYNAAAQPAPLGQIRITDDILNAASAHQFPPLSYLAAQGIYGLEAKGNSATPENWSELPFRLTADQAWISLAGLNGVVIDQFNLLCQQPDLSVGRSPDGSAALANFILPTPGLPNATAAKIASDPAYANALALMNNIRVTEVMYNPGTAVNSQQEEFIEIRNNGSTAVNLLGVRFTKGLVFTFPNVSLAAGAFGLVINNQAAFEARYGTGLPVLGITASTLSNAGERITLSLPLPFRTAIQTFVFNDKWYPETDGLGRSLVAVDYTAPLANWDIKDGWTASPLAGGTPGSAGPPQITSALTAGGTQGVSFSYQIAAANQPTTFSATGLPAGLTVNAATGLISGAPTAVGVSTVSITAQNTAGSDTKTLTITIVLPPAPIISSPLTAGASLTAPFTYQITATNAPTTYSVGALPSWLTYTAATHTLSGTATAVGNYTISMTVTNSGGTDTKNLVITVSSDPFSAALDGLGLSYSTGGTSNWFVQTSVTHDGVDAMQSGAIGNSQENYLQTTVTGPDRLSFYWKVGSESGYDYLNFNVDGTTIQNISGTVDWTQVIYSVPAGPHTIQWIYRKDSSVTVSPDAAYLDQVSLASQSTEPLVISALNVIAYEATPFSYQIVATHSPTNYAASGLPSGLFISPTTGQIYGTPAATSGSSYNVNLTITGATGVSTAVLVLSIVSSPDAIANAVETPTIVYRRGGDRQWNAQTTTTHDGVDAVRSGAIGPSQQSWMELDVTGPDRITFWWKVSSYQYGGYLYYGLDGNLSTNIAGEVDWQQVAVDVPAGPHTFRWTYYRYSSTTVNGSNAGYVDQVVVASNNVQPTILSLLKAYGAVGTPFNYQITATRNPTTFGTSALPVGLTLDPVTGIISGTPTVEFNGPITVTAEGDTGVGSASITFSISSSDAGLLAALDLPAGTPITRSGTGYWRAQTTTTHDGVDAAETPHFLNNGDYADMTITLPGPDRLSFWWRTSGSDNELDLYVNNSYQTYLYGENSSWARIYLDLPNATNTVRWQYYKYSTIVSGSNAGWVDELTLASRVPMITSALNVNAIAGFPFRYQVTASQNPTAFSASLPAGLTISATGLITGTFATRGTYTITPSATTPLGNASNTITINVGANPASLAVGADTQGLIWSQGSSASYNYNGWYSQTAVTHDGIDALQAGATPHYGYSYTYLTLDGPGVLTFWWKQTSTSGNDSLYFDDGNNSQSVSGEVAWTQRTTTFTSNGSRTVEWRWEHNYEGGGGSAAPNAAAYLDQVVWTPTDSDNDGLPDTWERANFPDLSATATADPDGDGQSNAKEAAAGTDPNSSASVFKVAAAELTADQSVHLIWNSVTGHTYALQSSPDLNSWTTYPNRIYATGPVTEATVQPQGATTSAVNYILENSPVNWTIPSVTSTLWRGGDEIAFQAAGGLTGWLTGVQGVGYERDNAPSGSNTPYTSFIGVGSNTESRMYGIRNTAYIRIPFTVTDPNRVRTLSLSMRYDDGMSAAINGSFVAADNYPTGTLSYNSSAQTSRTDSVAATYRTFDISTATNYLRPGMNILAIQGLNSSSSFTSSDFIIQAKLSGTETNLAPANSSGKLYWRVITQ